MANHSYWQYCTIEHCKELLMSYELLGNSKQPDDRQIFCLYILSKKVEKHYTPITIPKRDGSSRLLLAPSMLLKRVQRNILHHILDAFPVSIYATAYQKNGGIIQNASVHVHQPKILKLDIKDFFGSIHFLKVYNKVFPEYLFPPAIRGLLTHLCCYDDYLPQGAPTSPTISNLVMKSFDDYIGHWCQKQNIRYSRYCDDMTFSGDFDHKCVKNKVHAFLETMGFELNKLKTHLLTPNLRQHVTGIVVNDKMQLSKQYRKSLRQELHYLLKYGVVSHLERSEYIKYHQLTPDFVKKYLQSILGKIQFIIQVNPDDKFFQDAKVLILDELLQLPKKYV